MTHWVVCDRFVKDGDTLYALSSDPPDGDVWPVALSKASTTEYSPGPSVGSWWGKVGHPYPNKVYGRFDGIIVRRRSD